MTENQTKKPPKYTIINKQLMSVDAGGSYRRIEPNIFECVKAECIAHAKGNLAKFLPYFGVHFSADDMPDLENWRLAFSTDNPPEKVKFDARLEGLMASANIDFSKPFDAEIADSIRSQFIVRNAKKIVVDADMIIQGELGDEGNL